MTGMMPEAALLSARLAELRSLQTYPSRDRATRVSIYAAACTPIGAESDLRAPSWDRWSRLRAALRALTARARTGRALSDTAEVPCASAGAMDRARPLYAVPAARLTPLGAASRTDAARIPLAGLPVCREELR
ncbi:MAG TPA: hypothetical protein VEK13_04935 [Thermoplasmata archaeon]|nr:hypothetical protein [Thermoplasmata archaeon]